MKLSDVMPDPDLSPLSSPVPVRRTALVVVGDAVIRELLMAHLRDAGFVPVPAASVAEARRLAGDVLPDVLLIDPDGPQTADLSFCVDLADDVLVVTLTQRADLIAAGAAAHAAALVVRKPCVPRELVAQILRQLARHRTAARPADAADVLRVGPVEVDVDRHLITVRCDEGIVPLDLPPIELRLLQCLMTRADRALSREQILRAVWGDGSDVDPRTVDQNIRRLRRELSSAGAGDLIRTVRGVGYRFSIEHTAA